MKIVFKSLIILFFSVLVCFNLQADEMDELPRVLFESVDPVGDDWGPGTYTYPQYKHFEPYRGLFDLTYFSIVEAGSDYIFELIFSEITDPWRSKYKFSHPLIEIYFDTRPGGSNQTFRPGAKIKFDPHASWDVMLHITGWWVKAFRPEDREEAEKTYWSDPEDPFDLEDAEVTLKDKTITIKVGKDILGNLRKANFYLLVGGFDSFGANYYREVKKESDNWAFGGAISNYSPRVIDLLVPEGKTQETILSVKKDSKEFVTIPYISIGGTKETPLIMDKFFIWLSIIIVSFLLILIRKIKSKKNSIPT